MDLVQYNDNAAAAFGAAAAAMSGDAKPMLRFDKGDWRVGAEAVKVPIGTKIAANLMEAEWGWQRWKDQKVADRRMVLVASGTAPPARDDLGHNDKGLWDVDEATRTPRDPWQRTIQIPVRELTGNQAEWVISGSSKGFEGACKALFKSFGDGMRTNNGKTPIIELAGDEYKHPTYGFIKVPVLNLVEWADLSTKEVAAPKKGKF